MNVRWWQTFHDDPNQAVAELFSGRAGVGSDHRLDVPELLYQAFPPNLVNERAQLGDALLSWLLDMRENYATQVSRLSVPVYGKRLGDALIALQLLDLPGARCQIRADLDAWLRWLLPLRLAPERDPALECWRLMTRGQRDVRHAAAWLRLAADPRREYLTVAWAGLRMLPNEDNARTNQVLMLQALLRHTVATHHDAHAALRLFDRRFAALRGIFPRGPQHWDQVLTTVLDTADDAQERMARDLARELRSRATSRGHPTRRRVADHTPVAKEQIDRLKADIDGAEHQPEVLARRLFELLEQNHRYAEATGVSYFFVRTLHNLGSRLLERHHLSTDEMARFGLMIERALVWEPTDPYCWMLWTDWFNVQGLRDAREWALREMLRIFPDNEPSRVELARLLRSRGTGDWDEAEHWLRQAVERNPDGGHSRVVLAKIMAERGRISDADTLLAEFLEHDPANTEVRQLLDLLRAGAPLDDGSDVVYEVRDGGEPVGSGEPVSWIPDSCDITDSTDVSPVLRELARRGNMAREFGGAQFANGSGHVARTELIEQETRRGDTLAGFYSQWLMPHHTFERPPHAWAWNACWHWQHAAQPERWQRLAKQFPEMAPETEFLRILAAQHQGDGREDVSRWFTRYETQADSESKPVIPFMRKRLGRVGDADPNERKELALAVMASAATSTLDFAAQINA